MMPFPRCTRDTHISSGCATNDVGWTVGKVIVAIGCTYELAALPNRSPLPTITALIRMARRHASRPLRVAAWAWCGVWCFHFLTD